MIYYHISYLEKKIKELLVHTPNNLTFPTIFEYYSAIHLSNLLTNNDILRNIKKRL